MGAVPLHYVDLRTFAYETEDEERVERALGLFLPEDAAVERNENEGHHGDRIVVLSARIENADGVRTVLEQIRRADEFETVMDELEERVDENCSLYLQFDKQAAYRGEVALGSGIMFRAKVEAYPATWENAIENARDALSQ